MTRLKLFIPILATAILAACPSQSIEQTARDTAAALNGTLTAAQTQHQAECEADKTLHVCTLINQGVAAQNVLVTAIEAYCSFSASAPPVDPNTSCIPVKSAKAGLKTAIANAQQLTNEIGKVVKS